ncbi:Kelch repeat-containing protein [Haliscomenobacter sp.]|uniref:Kelch repeat-containing protein n=1 Tax=Haliscomenobacter sp. TaxID=2717303 RepID=UPI003BA848BF
MKNLGYHLKSKICLFLLLLSSGCIGPELVELDFVEVFTEKPRGLGLGTLILSGNVKRTIGNKNPLSDHGFVWAKNWSGELKDFEMGRAGIETLRLGALNKEGFKDTLPSLEPNQIVYHFRAYAVTDVGPIYGNLESFSFNFLVETDTITNGYNNEVTVSANLFGLEALQDSIIDRGHILDPDTAKLFLKPGVKKTSLKSSNDDGTFYSTFKNLAFNTLYYTKAYVQTRDGQIVYSKKVIPVKIRDGWLRVKNMPENRAHMIGGAVGNRAYISLGCNKEDCLLTNSDAVDVSYQYDPLNDTLGRWTEIQSFNGIPTVGAISFNLNNRLYVGLGNKGNGRYYDEIWAFDPASIGGSWNLVDTFPGGGRDGAVAFVINNKAYIGAGGSIDTNGNEVFMNDFYEYNPQTPRGARWKKVKSLPVQLSTGTLEQTLGRKNAAAFSLGGMGYVGTGTSGFEDLKDFWSFDPNRNQWLLIDALPGGPRRGALGFSIGDKGYLGMGFLAETGTYLADLWEFNPNAISGKKWRIRTSLLGGGRSNAVSFVIGNKAYVGGGRSIKIKNNNLEFILYPDFWMYTPETN